MTKKQLAKRNIFLFTILRTLQKRAYLPVMAVYFAEISGLSLSQIGFVVAAAAIASLLIEVPTGYISDRFGRAFSIKLYGLILLVGLMSIIIFQNFGGVLFGMILQAISFAFMSGNGDALLHDSLVVLDREDEFTKVGARAQSVSLAANMVILATIPLSYAIDPRLPFVAGVIMAAIIITVGFYVTDFSKVGPEQKEKKLPLKELYSKYGSLIPFAVFFGMVNALYIAPAKVMDLAIVELGFKPEYLGWLMALASLFGVIIGPLVKHMRNIGIKKFTMLDSLMLFLTFVAFTTTNLPFIIVLFIIPFGFWRYRGIVYNHYILEKYPTKYKATLLSSIRNIELVHLVWIAFGSSLVVEQLGYQPGFTVITIFSLLLITPFMYFTTKALKK